MKLLAGFTLMLAAAAFLSSASTLQAERGLEAGEDSIRITLTATNQELVSRIKTFLNTMTATNDELVSQRETLNTVVKGLEETRKIAEENRDIINLLYKTDQCRIYNTLSEESRHHSTGGGDYGDNVNRCIYPASIRGPDWKGQGWYRVKEDTHGSTRLASSAEVNTYEERCGSTHGGYVESFDQPEFGQTKNASVCFHSVNMVPGMPWKCDRRVDIKVTNCGAYLVYYLPKTGGCRYRYCIG